jgi:hypothetical protein
MNISFEDCASLVRKAGCAVAGPSGSVEDAFDAINDIDGALLDVNLDGDRSLSADRRAEA